MISHHVVQLCMVSNNLHHVSPGLITLLHPSGQSSPYCQVYKHFSALFIMFHRPFIFHHFVIYHDFPFIMIFHHFPWLFMLCKEGAFSLPAIRRRRPKRWLCAASFAMLSLLDWLSGCVRTVASGEAAGQLPSLPEIAVIVHNLEVNIDDDASCVAMTSNPYFRICLCVPFWNQYQYLCVRHQM